MLAVRRGLIGRARGGEWSGGGVALEKPESWTQGQRLTQTVPDLERSWSDKSETRLSVMAAAVLAPSVTQRSD